MEPALIHIRGRLALQSNKSYWVNQNTAFIRTRNDFLFDSDQKASGKGKIALPRNFLVFKMRIGRDCRSGPQALCCFFSIENFRGDYHLLIRQIGGRWGCVNN